MALTLLSQIEDKRKKRGLYVQTQCSVGVGKGERGREGPAQQTGERGREGPAMNIDILMKAAGGGRGGEREEGGVKGVFRETNRTGQK